MEGEGERGQAKGQGDGERSGKAVEIRKRVSIGCVGVVFLVIKPSSALSKSFNVNVVQTEFFHSPVPDQTHPPLCFARTLTFFVWLAQTLAILIILFLSASSALSSTGAAAPFPFFPFLGMVDYWAVGAEWIQLTAFLEGLEGGEGR